MGQQDPEPLPPNPYLLPPPGHLVDGQGPAAQPAQPAPTRRRERTVLTGRAPLRREPLRVRPITLLLVFLGAGMIFVLFALVLFALA